MPKALNWHTYCLIFLTGFIWGSSFLFVKLAVKTIPAYTLTMGRLAIAALILWAVLHTRGKSLPLDKASLKSFSFIGFFGSALPFTLINWGEIHIPSGLAAVLMGIMPISTALLAHFFIPSEPLGPGKGLGIGIGFGGLLVLVGMDAVAGLDSSVLAQAALLVAAISYAQTTTFTRLRVTQDGLVMATGATLLGFVWVAPFALLWDRPWEITPDAVSVSATLILAVFPSALGTLLFFHLIARVGANVFAQVKYLIPLVGALLGVVFLGETLDWRLLCALFLVLSGLTIVSLAR